MRDSKTIESPAPEIAEQETRPVARPRPGVAPAPKPPHKFGLKPLLVTLAVVAIALTLFLAGYLPRISRLHKLSEGVDQARSAHPQVNIAIAKGTAPNSDILLPGNITPLTEAVINARAVGYVKRRIADIGDRVKAGQLLAEIEAPELDQQVDQARATLSQTRAALARAEHVLAQSQANLRLSTVTQERWKTLVDRGVVSKQEFDQRQAQLDADQAAVHSAESDVQAGKDNITATDANLNRIVQLQDFEKVTAPFTGIVTARNIDIGALISTSGSTPMFRIAQIDVLRLVVDVPEQSVPFVKVGEPAELTLQEFGNRKFQGFVSRTTNALDPNTRTLGTEIQVKNPTLELLPNMFALVRIIGVRTSVSILVPGDALIARPEGTMVAVLRDGDHVHFQPVEVGRDYGAELEIRSGLSVGDRVVVNPTDDVREGAAVSPVLQKTPQTPTAPRASAPAKRP